MSKERPILFSGPMVRALLNGSKTQTRRVLKPQPTEFVGGPGVTLRDGSPAPLVPLDDSVEPYGREIVCPYGQPGERLWVREAFDFLPSGGPDQPQACEIVYWATGSTEPRSAPHDYNPMIYGHQKVRPSIHMPRWASRITLEITSVRVERLQDISESDSIAEGVTPLPGGHMWTAGGVYDGPLHDTNPRAAYRRLWESINGPDSWAANPWVWAVEFRRLP